jgi:hypothetical protein
MVVHKLLKKIGEKDWRSHSRNIIINGELNKFKKAFKVNFVTLMISSLGLLVALTWNNFWNAWVNSLTIENTVPYKFYLAILITLVAVVLTYLFSRIKGQD